MKNKITEKLKRPFEGLVNSLRARSIQLIITISFAIVTIIAMLFVGIILYNKFLRTAEQNAAISTQQIVEQINSNMNYYLKNMIYISSLLESNIKKDQDLPNSKLLDQMDLIINTRDDIVALAVFTDKGEIAAKLPSCELKSRININNQDWFVSAVKNPNSVNFSLPHVHNVFYGKHNWVVSLSKGVKFTRNNKVVQGVLLVDMKFSSLDQLCREVNLGKKGYIYIVDYHGNIIYHPQQQLLYMGFKQENINSILKQPSGSFIENFQGKKRLITVRKEKYTRWNIVGVSYLDEFLATKNELSRFAVLVLILGILFVIIISISISAEISKPIKQLEKSMKLVEEGRFDVTIDIRGEYEVVRLSNTFNIMVAKIKNLMEQIVVEQEAKRKSELNALQSQINPHFLYNTLDSVVWMAENGKMQDVITMITALARLFRISISRGKNIITVKEELEHAKNYLIIQKIRYKNKFEFHIQSQEGTLECLTIKLILQPIIENAIYHGIEYMVDEGMIDISVSIEDNKLVYVVSDNGLGMEPELLEKILFAKTKKSQGSGVGIKNVHERIRLYYGEEYGLKIESEREVGTTVRIYLPLVKNQD